MPLFHIHGLVAAVSASLAAGGSVWCAPGFDALALFRLDAGCDADLVHRRADDAPGDPARAARNADTIADVPLRFLRSSSASLPAPVMTALAEDLRRAGDRGLRHDRSRASDVSNPLPPRAQKARLGRLAAGPEVRIAA
jgi:acyl-CoA synthetase (AMP-forming)/AMP-acid ligase II